MRAAIKIGVVGFGKIAKEQHLPALGLDPNFRVVAVASKEKSGTIGVPSFDSLEEMLRAVPQLEAVSICTPPLGRYGLAKKALEHGLHVLLEKPPATTVYEAMVLKEFAARKSLTLYASWHSRHAAAVEAARAWLAGSRVHHVDIAWKEDVNKWHPGQDWIWQLGGLGVFDAGINALSIVTRLLSGRLAVKTATLWYPANRAMPVAANLELDGAGAIIDAEFDFRHSGEECWDIRMSTDGGELLLAQGGSRLFVDGEPVAIAPISEYAQVYGHFAALIRASKSDVDLTPLRLVSEAFLFGKRLAAPAL